MIPIGFLAGFGTGAGPRFRWGLAGLSFLCGIMLLVMMLEDLDTYDTSPRRFGVPLAISQLTSDKSASSSISWKESRENVYAGAPLAALLAARLGVVSSNDTNEVPATIYSAVPRQLHTLNSSSVVKILPFNESNIGLFVASKKLASGAGDSDPFRTSISIWSRPTAKLFRRKNRFSNRLSPTILSDDWRMVTEIDQTGHIEKIAFDLGRRRVAIALKSFGDPFRTLSVLEFDDDWNIFRQRSTISLRQGPVHALALTRGDQLVFSLANDKYLFSSLDLSDFGIFHEGPDAVARMIESSVASIEPVPSLSSTGSNRIIVSSFLANHLHQQYSTKLYEYKDGTWVLNDNFSNKPFASRDASVTLPNIVPSANFVAESSSRMVCLTSTPFVMSVEASMESNAIRIINLEPKIQFTHIALDDSGELIALADNHNNLVFLERTYQLDSPLFWEVQSEFSLPSNLEDKRILSIALLNRGTILVAVLQGGVIVSFDLRQQSSDNVSVFLELHWELLLLVVSLISYAFISRLGRNIMGLNNVFIPRAQRFRPPQRNDGDPTSGFVNS